MAGEALAQRQSRVLSRALKLEVALACVAPRPDAAAAGGADGDAHEAWGVEQPLLGEAHERLRAELLRLGIHAHRFVRVPPNYYDTPLEERRRSLRAHGVLHLCKTICCENVEWVRSCSRLCGQLVTAQLKAPTRPHTGADGFRCGAESPLSPRRRAIRNAF
jgi:hypothetical protein